MKSLVQLDELLKQITYAGPAEPARLATRALVLVAELRAELAGQPKTSPLDANLLARPVLEEAAKAVADSAVVWTGFAMQDAKTCIKAALGAMNGQVALIEPDSQNNEVWAEAARRTNEELADALAILRTVPAGAQVGAGTEPVQVAGLGRITNEDDGYLTLQFKDEDAAQAFMNKYNPSVEVDDMPPMRDTAPTNKQSGS